MPYRNDIEGLRGIAVLLVIFFHFGLPWCGGGFLGVDVFFVLSGYLITQILLRDLEGDSFSLVGFYRRRVVRILPALLAMLLITCIVASLVLLPVETRTMGMSAAAAAGFASNFFFWSSTNYFNVAEVRPLIHTWSLGVEEQFYLLYPLLLFALWRWARIRLKLLLWLATLGSLLLSRWLVRDHPDAAFFVLPSRSWELGIGAVVAAGGFPAIRAKLVRALISGAALAVLVAASLTIMRGILSYTLIPAPGAIPICAATALLLAYGDGTPGAKLLAIAPLRWIGRISYSLYLWHFPLIVFYYRAGFDPAPIRVALPMLALASLVIAFLSYRFVETPFRRRFREHGNPRAIVAGGIAACAAVAAACVGIAFAAPFLRPLPPDVARVAAYAAYHNGAEFEYQFGPVECYGATRHYDAARCMVPDPAKHNILVVGDSYAGHVWRAIAERFPGDKVMVAASGGCRPLIGGGGLRLCREMFAQVMRDAVGAHRVQAVVLAGHWRAREIPLLAPTIRAITAQGVSVTVIGPVVTYQISAPRIIAMAMLKGDPASAARQRLDDVGQLDSEMRAAAVSAGAHYYSLYDRECPGGQCRLLTRGGAPFHFDNAHLTLDGARELVEKLPRP
jgi:peptidoglycan/LPS O-acetylase OafA/YrhL